LGQHSLAALGISTGQSRARWLGKQAGKLGSIFAFEPADLGVQVHGHQVVAGIFYLASFRDFLLFSRGYRASASLPGRAPEAGQPARPS
jgi:hypothetical protein